MTKNRDRTNDVNTDDDAPGADRSRDMSGASYGATEREQTKDLRRRDPQGDADVADGGVSEFLEQNSDSPAD